MTRSLAQLKEYALKLWNLIEPPPQWRLPVIILAGIFAGLGVYVIHISNAVSYLSDRPETCMNCHVMSTEFATWERSQHRNVATCVDCHVPQDNFIHKYLFKAQDGMRHASIFTLRLEPQSIRIKDAGRKAVQNNCLRCHSTTIHKVEAFNSGLIGGRSECWSCHREVPHGQVKSLSSTPYARVPKLAPVIPQWLTELMKKEKSR